MAAWFEGELLNTTTIVLRSDNTGGIIAQLKQKLKVVNRPYCGVVIEGVELFSGSAVSYTSAARGNLFLLSYIIGALLYHFIDSNPVVVQPHIWKGQLNYKQLRYILKTKFGFEANNDHIAAAVGIGHWARGAL
jgi:hypothetical protein